MKKTKLLVVLAIVSLLVVGQLVFAGGAQEEGTQKYKHIV